MDLRTAHGMQFEKDAIQIGILTGALFVKIPPHVNPQQMSRVTPSNFARRRRRPFVGRERHTFIGVDEMVEFTIVTLA